MVRPVLGGDMKRRKFITLLGGAAASWPLATRAQQPDRMRRMSMLMSSAEDHEAQSWVAALREELGKLGWMEGRNIETSLGVEAIVAPRHACSSTPLLQPAIRPRRVIHGYGQITR
jgi:hypothetical protein